MLGYLKKANKILTGWDCANFDTAPFLTYLCTLEQPDIYTMLCLSESSMLSGLNLLNATVYLHSHT